MKKREKGAWKLTDEIIEKIRSMYKEHSAGYIALELGVSEAVVYKYTKGMEKPGGSESKPKPPLKEDGGFKSFSGEKSQQENEEESKE